MEQKVKRGEKLKIYYNLAKQGLSNAEIGQMMEVSAKAVNVGIHYYCKKHKIELPNRGNPRNRRKNHIQVWQDDLVKTRERNHDLAVRRKDGVLKCPTRYCTGYGLNG